MVNAVTQANCTFAFNLLGFVTNRYYLTLLANLPVGFLCTDDETEDHSLMVTEPVNVEGSI